MIDVFEGPMDLLLHLIDKAEIDIYDIPINVIAEQFLDSVKQIVHKVVSYGYIIIICMEK